MDALKLPKGWNEVSVETYLKYHTVITSKIDDPIDLEIRIISVLSGTPTEDVEKIKTKDILKMIKGLSFLKELPTKKVPFLFKCGKGVYRTALTMDEMLGSQFMNFSEITKGVKPEDYIYYMTDLIGAMCTRRERGIFLDHGKLSFVRYKYDGYKENSRVFKENMKMSEAYPYYVFFCRVMEKLYPATQDYLIRKTKKLAKQRKWPKWAFLNIGVGTRSLMP